MDNFLRISLGFKDWYNFFGVMRIEKRKVALRLIEFFFVGLVMGVIEDILAIHFATSSEITFETLKVAAIVAFPFAIFSELIVDAAWVRERIAHLFRRLKKSDM